MLYVKVLEPIVTQISYPCRKKKRDAGFKQQTIKYTALRLYEKGVILEIEGLPQHQ